MRVLANGCGSGLRRRRRSRCSRAGLPTLLAALLLAGPRVAVATTPSAAVFDFELDATGPQSSVDDAGKLQHLGEQLRDQMTQQGYSTVSTAPVDAEAKASHFRTCDGCDVPLAAKLGANVAVNGWVQKVSNLILNVNVVVREVPSGKVLHAGSVDIRGNTETSWSRGLTYLMQRLYPPKPTS